MEALGLYLAVEKKYTDEDIAAFPLWNWLIYELTAYIYHTFDGSDDRVQVPDLTADNEFTIWFKSVFAAFSEEFYDATHARVLRCLENIPEKPLADMVYSITPLHIQRSFLAALVHSVPPLPSISVNELADPAIITLGPKADDFEVAFSV